jgi:hypothetical protein
LLYFIFFTDAYFYYLGQFMATQLEKAISSAAKHKAALDELNAALGLSIVRPWEKMYADYYTGNAQVNIFQDANDGASIYPQLLFPPHSPLLQTPPLPPSSFSLPGRMTSSSLPLTLKLTSLRPPSSLLAWTLKLSAASSWPPYPVATPPLLYLKLQIGRPSSIP